MFWCCCDSYDIIAAYTWSEMGSFGGAVARLAYDDGAEEWEYKIPDDSGNKRIPVSVVSDSDGYIYVLWKYLSGSPGKYGVLKLDIDGNLEWNYDLQSANNSSMTGTNKFGKILYDSSTGYTYSIRPQNNTYSTSDCITILDSDGSLVDSYTWSDMDLEINNRINDAKFGPDGNIWIAGSIEEISTGYSGALAAITKAGVVQFIDHASAGYGWTDGSNSGAICFTFDSLDKIYVGTIDLATNQNLISKLTAFPPTGIDWTMGIDDFAPAYSGSWNYSGGTSIQVLGIAYNGGPISFGMNSSQGYEDAEESQIERFSIVGATPAETQDFISNGLDQGVTRLLAGSDNYLIAGGSHAVSEVSEPHVGLFNPNGVNQWRTQMTGTVWDVGTVPT